jgi:hypothetical protein
MYSLPTQVINVAVEFASVNRSVVFLYLVRWIVHPQTKDESGIQRCTRMPTLLFSALNLLHIPILDKLRGADSVLDELLV